MKWLALILFCSCSIRTTSEVCKGWEEGDLARWKTGGPVMTVVVRRALWNGKCLLRFNWMSDTGIAQDAEYYEYHVRKVNER